MLLAVGCHSISPTRRAWPRSSFSASVMLFVSKCRGMFQILTYKTPQCSVRMLHMTTFVSNNQDQQHWLTAMYESETEEGKNVGMDAGFVGALGGGRVHIQCTFKLHSSQVHFLLVPMTLTTTSQRQLQDPRVIFHLCSLCFGELALWLRVQAPNQSLIGALPPCDWPPIP